MTPERSARIERLLQDALEREASDRGRFLEAACGDDTPLRVEVESLLAAAEEAGDFLELPALAGEARFSAEEEPGPARERIGPYQVLREIGRGGMGNVYLAVRADREYQKRVAIKVVRRGMDTDFILRRFRQERQILAGLDHPNIARLTDGGTTDDGRPYLVMDYVDGESIIRYCDGRKLGIRDRLRLFQTVCSAVAFAHQNLVVHRDIKPGNVLVTPAGVPKLIDFGVAKLLNPDLSPETVDLTGEMTRLLTPDYASPEQLRGERITTACDVYSLGVLLYELSTGHRPHRFEQRTPEAMARAVSEARPEKPSLVVGRSDPSSDPSRPETNRAATAEARNTDPAKLKKLLSGDLDTIILRALDYEPHRRYPSVERFSDDIRRFLEGRPVTARKDTLGYRSRKFLARHKAAAVAGALLFASVLGGVAMTARQARIAARERTKAEERLKEVRKLTNSFLFEFHDAIANLPGSTPARELLVRRALEYLGTLAKAGGDDLSLQRELASAYEKVGGVQGLGGSANLGDTAGALESYRAARVILERLVSGPSVEDRDRLELAGCHLALSRIHIARMDLTEALEEGRQALTIREALGRSGAAISKLATRIGGAHQNLGLILHMKGDTAGSLAELQRAASAFDLAIRQDPTDVDARRGKGATLFETASVLSDSGDPGTALERGREVVEIEEGLLELQPNDSRLKMDLALALHDVGEYNASLGDLDAAVEATRSAVSINDKLVAADPKNAQAQIASAYFGTALGALVAKQGHPEEALRLHRAAISASETLLRADPANGYAKENLARGCAAAGNALSPAVTGARMPALSDTERWRDARSWYRRSFEVWSAIQAAGKLRPAHAGEPARMAAAVARCDRELSSGDR